MEGYCGDKSIVRRRGYGGKFGVGIVRKTTSAARTIPSNDRIQRQSTCRINMKNPTSGLKWSILLLTTVCLITTAQSGFCPTDCTCDDDTLVVSCIGVSLDVIPIALNPSTQRIVLKESRIRMVDAAAFQFYGDLKIVDLSSNHLVTIPDASFAAQKNLVELHLRHNKISALTEKTFQGLVSLTVLNLRDNYLETLSNGLFTSLTKLEELDLGQNRIGKVEPGAFQKLGSLRVLYLDDNQLKSIPSPALAPLNALAELHIGLNVFSSLPDDGFKGLERLAVLDVMDAGLDNISEGAFRGLTSLRTLKLGGNKLREVPTKQLSILTRLEELTLGQNSFTMLRSGAFQGLSNLKKLDISGAKLLTTLERGTFSDNGNLETLILKSNRRLTTLEEGALAGLPNLRHLILRDNAFVTFPESLVSWSELHKFDISENPLICDCSLHWLASFLAPKNTSAVVCAEPLEVRLKPLKGMTSDELGCAFSDPRKQAVLLTVIVVCLGIIAGMALVLYYRCRKRVRDALKDYKWKNRAISRKEHEYQKTFSDDEYIVRAAHGHHHHINNQGQLHHGQFPQQHQQSEIIDGSNTIGNGGVRVHHTSHSLRRNPPALPARGDLDRIQNGGPSGRIQNGGQRHSPPCPQSSYPTLPINGHGHHYHHYRERSRERGRERERELPIVPHRGEKQYNGNMELEVHQDGGIGTYRA
ncbi:insulin-like growth factor-binding protein complex acid labile subunit isoform X1 [Diachasma alloeum]|uniref:insulin-like growth factor-binding protein complex acid labile subunit isoform X1 n=1 Tax=Diachasma alloeum TaxID=454923 RepID=UPI00073846EC|nr:insulin-like growth factor-binding protein complex acid labile subunit isoform X1 [Diachasma alloeum]XP_015110110.1 insulin-like growth factor-binding protein complex acid labile subunit isoform X1 [Diachasma alloeum]XP_015110111.1 insulin-like growth factor-binding protein complex acid labile subunit isoform X1 [Diachasma alloeum]